MSHLQNRYFPNCQIQYLGMNLQSHPVVTCMFNITFSNAHLNGQLCTSQCLGTYVIRAWQRLFVLLDIYNRTNVRDLGLV